MNNSVRQSDAPGLQFMQPILALIAVALSISIAALVFSPHQSGNLFTCGTNVILGNLQQDALSSGKNDGEWLPVNFGGNAAKGGLCAKNVEVDSSFEVKLAGATGGAAPDSLTESGNDFNPGNVFAYFAVPTGGCPPGTTPCEQFSSCSEGCGGPPVSCEGQCCTICESGPCTDPNGTGGDGGGGGGGGGGGSICGDGIIDSGEECGENGITCNPGYQCILCQCVSRDYCGNGQTDPIPDIIPTKNEECGEPGLFCPPGSHCENCECFLDNCGQPGQELCPPPACSISLLTNPINKTIPVYFRVGATSLYDSKVDSIAIDYGDSSSDTAYISPPTSPASAFFEHSYESSADYSFPVVATVTDTAGLQGICQRVIDFCASPGAACKASCDSSTEYADPSGDICNIGGTQCCLPKSTCEGLPNPQAKNSNVTWTAHPTGNPGDYSYAWTLGQDAQPNGPLNGQYAQATYPTIGAKSASVIVTDNTYSNPVDVSCLPVNVVDSLPGCTDTPGQTCMTSPCSSQGPYVDGTGTCPIAGEACCAPAAADPTVTCSGAPVSTGQSITWTATVTPSGSYTYTWHGNEIEGRTGRQITEAYDSAGTKTAKVTVESVTSPTCDATAEPNCATIKLTSDKVEYKRNPGEPINLSLVISRSSTNVSQVTYQGTYTKTGGKTNSAWISPPVVLAFSGNDLTITVPLQPIQSDSLERGIYTFVVKITPACSASKSAASASVSVVDAPKTSSPEMPEALVALIALIAIWVIMRNKA